MFSNVHSGTPSSFISVIRCSTKSCVNTVACFQVGVRSLLAEYVLWQSWRVFMQGLFNGQVATLRLKRHEWQTPYLFLKCHVMQVKQRGSLSFYQLSFIALLCTAGVVSSCLKLKAGLHPGQVGSSSQGSTARQKAISQFASGVMPLGNGSKLHRVVSRKVWDPWPCCEAD